MWPSHCFPIPNISCALLDDETACEVTNSERKFNPKGADFPSMRKKKGAKYWKPSLKILELFIIKMSRLIVPPPPCGSEVNYKYFDWAPSIVINLYVKWRRACLCVYVPITWFFSTPDICYALLDDETASGSCLKVIESSLKRSQLPENRKKKGHMCPDLCKRSNILIDN